MTEQKQLLKEFLNAKVYEFLDWRTRCRELTDAYLALVGDERGSQKQLAKDIGMTEQTISNARHGRRFFTKSSMQKFYALVEEAMK